MRLRTFTPCARLSLLFGGKTFVGTSMAAGVAAAVGLIGRTRILDDWEALLYAGGVLLVGLTLIGEGQRRAWRAFRLLRRNVASEGFEDEGASMLERLPAGLRLTGDQVQGSCLYAAGAVFVAFLALVLWLLAAIGPAEGAAGALLTLF